MVETIYTLTEHDSDSVVIEVGGLIEPKPGRSSASRKTSGQGEHASSQSGQIILDRRTGRLISSTVVQKQTRKVRNNDSSGRSSSQQSVLTRTLKVTTKTL